MNIFKTNRQLRRTVAHQHLLLEIADQLIQGADESHKLHHRIIDGLCATADRLVFSKARLERAERRAANAAAYLATEREITAELRDTARDYLGRLDAIKALCDEAERVAIELSVGAPVSANPHMDGATLHPVHLTTTQVRTLATGLQLNPPKAAPSEPAKGGLFPQEFGQL